MHPAHPFPIQMETKSLEKALLAMNDYGLFTFQGQPQTDGGFIIPPCTCEHKSEKDDNVDKDDNIEEDEMLLEPTDDDPNCRVCGQPPQNEPDQWTEVRQLPYGSSACLFLD